MHERVSKSSSWTPTSSQKKSKSLHAKPSTSIQPKQENISSQQQEMPTYSTAAADLLAANIMRSLEPKEQEPSETSTGKPHSESGHAAFPSIAAPIPSTPVVQSQEIGIQRQCSECAKEQSTEEGKDIDEISAAASGIQTKLTIGAPPNPYQQAANQMAEVMSKPILYAPMPQVQRFSPEASQIQRRAASAQSISPMMQMSVEQQAQMSALIQRTFRGEGTQASFEPVQAKLTVGEPGDKYEQEADAVAHQVVEKINAPTTEPSVQRQSEVGGASELNITVMRQSAAGVSEGASVTQDVEQGIQQARGGGQTLDESVREPMEQAFGGDFSGVRVHTDANADHLNRSISARAFTTGQNIFFKQGEYNPGSRGGQKLLAHELTHVVQQNGSTPKIQRDHSKSESKTQTSPQTNKVAFVREEGLNLRESPDQKSTSLAKLTFGQRVHTLEDPNPQQGWQKVTVLGQIGYVYAPKIHFPPEHLIQKDPALSLIKVKSGETFWSLVKKVYGIQGNESTPDQNINHFINAIRAVNKPEAFKINAGLLDEVGNFFISGRDASDTELIAGVDLWIPSFGVAAKMDVGSGTVTGEISRYIKKIEQKIEDFKVACQLSGKFIPKAIAKHAGEVGGALLEGLIKFAIEAAAILAVSTAVGALIGSLFGGVGAVPGAEIGFEVGLLILEAYGIYMLIEAVLGIAGNLLSQLGQFIQLVWTANGDQKKLEEAAKSLAEALGILVSAVLVALSAYIIKKGVGALSKTKFAQTVGEKPLMQWVKQRQQFQTSRQALKTAKTPKKPSQEPSKESTSGNKELEEARKRLVNTLDLIAKKKELGTDPKRGYIEHEGEVGLLLHQGKYGPLKRDPTGAGEWIGAGGNYQRKTFDLVGVPQGKSNFHSPQMEKFLPSVDSHFLKSIDYVVLDTRYMTPAQKTTVMNHIQKKWSSQANRLITLE